MAEQGHYAADIPQMDYVEHERTYKGFVHFAEVGTVACIAIVAALAVGGSRHAWGTALVGTLLAIAATAIGLASRQIGWRAPLAPLILMLLALILY